MYEPLNLIPLVSKFSISCLEPHSAVSEAKYKILQLHKNYVFTSIPRIDNPDGTTEALLSKSTYASLTAIPNYPNRLKHPRTTLYTIADAGKMGRGMFAANDISAGELILSRRPLCLMPKGLVPHEATPRTFTPEQIAQLNHENTEAIEELYNRMTPERRALFDDLFNSHLNDDSSRVRGIIRTNGYGTRKLDKDRHVGICPI